MQKQKKKGFTLIETLVVIAIIAILVAIAVPNVLPSLDRAAAAANAADLRILQSELTAAKQSGLLDQPAAAAVVREQVYGGVKLPKPRAVGPVTRQSRLLVQYDQENDSITVSYEGFTIESFAEVASGEVQARDMKKSVS